MKNYRAFQRQVENIQTENDLKAAHISICRAYSDYHLSHTQFMDLREKMIARRAEKGFSWGRGI